MDDKDMDQTQTSIREVSTTKLTTVHNVALTIQV